MKKLVVLGLILVISSCGPSAEEKADAKLDAQIRLLSYTIDSLETAERQSIAMMKAKGESEVAILEEKMRYAKMIVVKSQERAALGKPALDALEAKKRANLVKATQAD